MTGMPAAPLDLVRSMCLALPEVTERLSHGAPSFFVRDKKTFVMFMDDHHGDGRLALWCAAPPGAQEEMLAQDPARFFRPPYVGHRGWLGCPRRRPAGLGRGRGRHHGGLPRTVAGSAWWRGSTNGERAGPADSGPIDPAWQFRVVMTADPR